ncbi:MAG: hypothetical protein RXO36_05025 [Candidatus Nanopusillus acidilobi]
MKPRMSYDYTLQKNIRGKPYITVSAKGISNGLSDIPNDGADFGPDTPGTQTSGIQEAINYAMQFAPNTPEIHLTSGKFTVNQGIVFPSTPYPPAIIGRDSGLYSTYIISGNMSSPIFSLTPPVYNLRMEKMSINAGQNTASYLVDFNQLNYETSMRFILNKLYIYPNTSFPFYQNGANITQGALRMDGNEDSFILNSIIQGGMSWQCGGGNLVIHNSILTGGLFQAIYLSFEDIISFGGEYNFYVGSHSSTINISGFFNPSGVSRPFNFWDNNTNYPFHIKISAIIQYRNTETSIMGGTANKVIWLDLTNSSIRYTGSTSNNIPLWGGGGLAYFKHDNVYLKGITTLPDQSTTSGTTAGTVSMITSEYSPSYTKYIITFTGYENNTTTNQSINFPLPFSSYAIITGNNTGLTITASTTGITITSPNSTTTYSGIVIVEGY